MKNIVIIFALMTVASALDQVIFKLPQERLIRFKKISDECALENKLEPGSLLQKIAEGKLSRDEATDNYLYCATLKGGLITEDGHIIPEKLGDLLGDHPLVEELKESARKCNEKVTNKSPAATAGEMNPCIITTSPVRFIV